ncbi:MAG: deoxyribonuclease IV [Thermoleophilia bacterium]|nr:deoxyribonuclease IV [Thermoleophilia bacterium]
MRVVSRSEVPLPRIGAQVSTAGGLLNAVKRATDIGAEVVQLFAGNPRQWRGYAYTDQQLEAFGGALRESRLLLFVHTIYLINMAGPDPALRDRSTQALAVCLAFAARTGAAGVVTHVGSHRGDGFETALPRIREAVLRAQEAAIASCGSADLPPLLLESSAGAGNSVGRDPAELGLMLECLAGSPTPVGLCLDTAHLFAAGLAVHTSSGLGSLTAALSTAGCLDAVRLVHLNDSRTPFGSRSDRHENLGEGELGSAGLAMVVRHPAFRRSPFVLEVPGFDGHGPDAENMRRARAMRTAAASPPTPIP